MSMSPITTKVTETVYLGTGTYTSGIVYASPLTIDSGGSVAPSGYTGANGVYSKTPSVSLTNDGTVTGGVSAAGGTGGIGVDLTASATFENDGSVTGGKGDFEASMTSSAGGAGVEMASGTFKSYGNIHGGVGVYNGAGGDGVVLNGTTLVSNSNSQIRGGAAYGSGMGGTGLVMNGATGTNYNYIGGGRNHSSGAGGTGVQLEGTASLINKGAVAGGSSTSGKGGLGAYVSGGTLTNDDSIKGGVGNSGGGKGANGAAVELTGSTATLDNNNYIAGANGIGGTGVEVYNGATLNTYAGSSTLGGSESGAVAGGIAVYIKGGGTLDAQGGVITGGADMSGTGGAGVLAKGTSTLTATVKTLATGAYNIVGGSPGTGFGGGAGVDLGAFSTLENYGRIEGGGATSTAGQGGPGVIIAGSTLANTNEAGGVIQGGGASGNSGQGGVGLLIAGSGAQLTNLGLIRGGADADIAKFEGMAGAGANIESGATLTNDGTVAGGMIGNGGPANGNVGVYIEGGTVIDGGVISGSAYTNSATRVVTYSDAVKFGSVAGGKLYFADYKAGAGTLNGALEGFKVGDTIQILGGSGTYTKSGNPDAGTYVIQTAHDGTLDFSGNYTGHPFIFTQTTNGSTVVTDITLACFRTGTLIRTPAGERRVETLRIGDAVTTLSGQARPIRWIGRRHYSATTAAHNPQVLPVRISADAFAPGLPRRDLWVSPEHAMYLDGALVAARELVNGVSIVQERAVDEVSYVHLEFASHEVLFAEGAPSESFVDDDSREIFDNADEFDDLYPDAPRQRAEFCAVRLEDGEALEAIRRRLNVRAGLPHAPVCAHSLRGMRAAR